jgi:hypothetical protein
VSLATDSDFQLAPVEVFTTKDWRPVRVARPRRGRVPIDVPHLRGDDAETKRRRRLFVRAQQARRRRTAEKEKLLDELHGKGFADLKDLRRGLSSARVGSHQEKDLEDLYERYKLWKRK